MRYVLILAVLLTGCATTQGVVRMSEETCVEEHDVDCSNVRQDEMDRAVFENRRFIDDVGYEDAKLRMKAWAKGDQL